MLPIFPSSLWTGWIYVSPKLQNVVSVCVRALGLTRWVQVRATASRRSHLSQSRQSLRWKRDFQASWRWNPSRATGAAASGRRSSCFGSGSAWGGNWWEKKDELKSLIKVTPHLPSALPLFRSLSTKATSLWISVFKRLCLFIILMKERVEANTRHFHITEGLFFLFFHQQLKVSFWNPELEPGEQQLSNAHRSSHRTFICVTTTSIIIWFFYVARPNRVYKAGSEE